MIKTFWEIEKAKTWRIYVLLGCLYLFYFVSIYVLWIFFKFLFWFRSRDQSFSLFGQDAIIILIIAMAAALAHWYLSSGSVTSRVLKLLKARPPDHHDRYHEMFRNVVDEIATAAGGVEVERCILPTCAMNAFALADFRGRKVIGVTEGLISRLSRHELSSVVGHEMAHIISGDCLLTTVTCSLFAVYSQALAQLQRLSEKSIFSPVLALEPDPAYRKGGNAIALAVPIFLVVFVTDLLSQLLNVFISRQKEYRADAAAVRLTRDPMSLAQALHSIGKHWRGAGFGGEYLSAIFILSPELNMLDEQENFWADLFSSHPPLIRRLQILLNMAHASFDDLSREIVGQQAENRKVVESVARDVKFLAENRGSWTGPLTAKQLMSFDWLMPSTQLRVPNQNGVVSADQIDPLRIFFKAREDPIWHIRRICPACSQWLIIESYEGLNIHGCAFCGGFLVEKHCLPRILVRREKRFSERIQRIAAFVLEETRRRKLHRKIILDMAHPRRCGKCGRPMIHKFYSYAYNVEIDDCEMCDLVWFDADELETLQCMVETAEATK